VAATTALWEKRRDSPRRRPYLLRILRNLRQSALRLEPIIDALHRAPDLLHFVHALLDDSGCALVSEDGAAGYQQHRPEGA
jgi:hypothetical protein